MSAQRTDREMLELAAKAAGYDVVWNEHWQCFQHRNPTPDQFGAVRYVWVPLDDDGDVLRLATKLRIDIEWDEQPSGRTVEAYQCGEESYFCATEAEADYRRAIVRAAAAIGEAMP